MKKKLYIVRHGQTLFNEKGLVQGWCDSPLTELGHRQAKATRDYFEKNGIDFDYAACSTLGRTEQTLKDITDLDYDRNPGLKEFFYGDLEGELIEEVIPKNFDPETFYKDHGGESKSEVEKRIYNTVKDIMEREDVSKALLVSHGSVAFRLAHQVDPVRAKKLRKFANCLIYEYEYEDGKLKLVDIIDKHVKDLK